MGKIILNGIEYIGGEADNVFDPVIYSDVERKIGVWRDNKPLYQKTLFATSGLSAHVVFSHGISNLDTLAKSECILRADDDSYQIPITTDQANAEFEVTPTNIEIWLNNNFLNLLGNGGYAITLQYTKTTDVAGSGDYNTYGVPTVHCDNTEKVVGTWLGETLYERSFVHTGNIANGAWVTIDNSYSPSNTGVMFVEHICFKLSGFDTLYASYGGCSLDVGIETAGKLYLENFIGQTVTKVWLTIRYTKI